MSSTSRKNDTTFTQHADGSLTIQGYYFKEVLRPWGHPEGFGVTGAAKEPYNGELRPMFLPHALRHYGDPRCKRDELPRPTGDSVDRIARSVPVEVLQAIYHLPQYQIELIQLAECFPDQFLRLVRWNPALCVVLARHAATHTLWGARYWGNYFLWRRPNDITRQLGLGSNCCKYLSKITETGLCSHGYLDLALSAWKQPGMARLLQHVRAVNLDTMTTAFNHWWAVSGCPSLLHIAAAGQTYSTEVYETVEEVIQLRRSMRMDTWPWRTVEDIWALRKIKERTIKTAAKEGKLADTCYPPPPVSPCSEWAWVSSLPELEEMGQRYQNCATSYHWRCLSGSTAIFVSRRTDWSDTVIVVLDKSGRGWSVSDVLGPANALVDDAEAVAVRRHFEEMVKGGDQ